jgi:ankyrin repeat protein
MLASISGDFECVEALCQFGADVNAQDIEQKTSLMFAAEAENMVIVNLLILHHADLSMRDKHHCSVLFLAAENNKLEVARVLLENEAHPLQRGRYLRSPMHEACRNKNLDMVKLLHEYNAKIDTIDQFFRTPLMLCAHASEYDTADPEVVAYLLEHKANVHRVDHDGAPIICRFASHPRALPLLLEHDPDLNAGDAINRTCLARVARNGDVPTARLIIERRAEVDVIDDTGATPIHWAVTNSLEMTQFLVEAKATVHGEANGLTPLHNACKSGYDVCKFLVDSGIDVTVRDPRGRTYLAHAAYCGNLKLVEMFFELGLSVDEPDMLGLTPLMLAAGTGYVEMVELLLKYGARLMGQMLFSGLFVVLTMK